MPLITTPRPDHDAPTRTCWAIACGLALGLAGCNEHAVLRVVDGRVEEGRFIPAHVYALVARGADAETHGNIDEALQAYTLATDADPQSPDLWTHLGTLRCRTQASTEALTDFARASSADDTYEPLHRERARCLLARADVAGALAEAERAVALDPDDVEASLVRAEALIRARRPNEARTVLHALRVGHPRSSDVVRALQALDRGAAASESPLAGVDAALRVGDVAEAHRLSQRARLGPAELAVRAAAMGLSAIARAEAEPVLGADPASASARVALATAAEQAGEETLLRASMQGLPVRMTLPSPLAGMLFAELLARRVGDDAARAWLAALPEVSETPDDPLLMVCAQRLRARRLLR